MIVKGETSIRNILEGPESIIVFAINTEGKNESGFAAGIALHYWWELRKLGGKLGSVHSKTFGPKTFREKTFDTKTFYAIVCHSLKKGWGTPEEQTATIKKCFDQIECPGNASIATVAIGTGDAGLRQGADTLAITRGMALSKNPITYYGDVPKEIIAEQIRRLEKQKSFIQHSIDQICANFPFARYFGDEIDEKDHRTENI